MIKNTQELRDVLLAAIEKVEKGDMAPEDAGAIVGLSGRVLDSAKLDLLYAKTRATMGNAEIANLRLASGVKK